MSQPTLALSGSNATGDVPFSCALHVDGASFAVATARGERRELAATIAEVAAAAGLSPAAIREIRMDVGPGSYTGLRVAVTFVRFLQRFGDLRVLAVDTLTWLAARARDAGGTSPVHVMLDARRERWHAAVLSPPLAGGQWTVQHAPAALPLPRVVDRIAAGDRCVVPALSLPLVAEQLAARGAIVLPAERLLATELFAADLPFAVATTADLEPRYLMASYAEGTSADQQG